MSVDIKCLKSRGRGTYSAVCITAGDSRFFICFVCSVLTIMLIVTCGSKRFGMSNQKCYVLSRMRSLQLGHLQTITLPIFNCPWFRYQRMTVKFLVLSATYTLRLHCRRPCLLRADWTQVCSFMSCDDPLRLNQTYQLSEVVSTMTWAASNDYQQQDEM